MTHPVLNGEKMDKDREMKKLKNASENVIMMCGCCSMYATTKSWSGQC
jgi:hypothetical protein